jgi:hypothetical protein
VDKVRNLFELNLFRWINGNKSFYLMNLPNNMLTINKKDFHEIYQIYTKGKHVSWNFIETIDSFKLTFPFSDER